MQVAIDSQIFMEESSTVTQNLSNLSEEYPYIIVKTDDDIWEYESKLNEFPNIKRKKYAMYSSEIKNKCIEMSQFEDPKIVAKKFAVPLKSLKRWLQVGCERRKGGGRKIRDPEMETILFSWYLDLKENKKISVTSKMVKQKALEITKHRDFIASKGWLEKFKKKHHLELVRSTKANRDLYDINI